MEISYWSLDNAGRLIMLTAGTIQWRILKGGFCHWRAKRSGKFLGCHTHFRSCWKFKLNISKQL